MKHAKDYKCSDCGKQAEVFFPCVDPDIPSYPYCKKCANERKMKLIMKLKQELKIEWGEIDGKMS